jgi:hypothetical protein
VFDLPKPLLKQLLTFKNTAPERLSNSELEIAGRICHCTRCDNYWVRRKHKQPDRCPACHARDWDRPLIAAMLAADGASHPAAQKSTPNPPPPGGQL